MRRLKLALKRLFCKTDVSGSAWERKLIGKNIHSVFTFCKDCHSKGVNIPFCDECGNCGSKNTVRYYDKETIDLLF
jgi:DnaJ-class molecular chaperone